MRYIKHLRRFEFYFLLLQMEFRGNHVHAAGRISSLLAQETDANAANDLGRKVRLLVPRMGGPLGHSQRFGKYTLF